MLIVKATQQQAELAAINVGLRVVEYRAISDTRARFRLGLFGNTPRKGTRQYQRLAPSGRRIAAVCWHGHRDFFRALFQHAPDCKVQTASTRQLSETYYTVGNFERMFHETDRNIGSMYQPMQYSDACECGREVQFSALWADGRQTDIRAIRQSDMMKCRFAIMVTEHYRADGSCKCDDPEHRAMMIREWNYTPADFATEEGAN